MVKIQPLLGPQPVKSLMEGFLRFRLPQWVVRLMTRIIALLPVIVVAILFGDQEHVLDDLLVYSQVFLSAALPFLSSSGLFHLQQGNHGRTCQCEVEYF